MLVLLSAGVLKLYVLPPAVKVYILLAAKLTLAVAPEAAPCIDKSCVWLPAAACVDDVPIVRFDLLFQVYFSPVVQSDTSVPPDAGDLFEYVVLVSI